MVSPALGDKLASSEEVGTAVVLWAVVHNPLKIYIDSQIESLSYNTNPESCNPVDAETSVWETCDLQTT
jgi:hypothetical protein